MPRAVAVDICVDTNIYLKRGTLLVAGLVIIVVAVVVAKLAPKMRRAPGPSPAAISA